VLAILNRYVFNNFLKRTNLGQFDRKRKCIPNNGEGSHTWILLLKT